MTRSLRRTRLLLAAAVVGSALVVGGPTATPVKAYPGTHVHLTGHGWGHGRGMGQFGALGYATNHGWSYTRVLDHYYGGTQMGAVNDDQVLSVHITRKNNIGVIVLNAQQFGGPSAVYVERIGPNNFRVKTGSGCGSVTTTVAEGPGPIDLTPKPGTTLGVCEAGPTVHYRGNLRVEDNNGSKLINFVSTRDYLRGVLPREVSPSWHMDALKAQAVAARSYARASNRPDGSSYNQCDTTQCQVYGGASAESARTDTAITETSGQVRVFTSNTGLIASTEFSSSTGGWTAGGTFPAVKDDGDSVSSNPNHTWNASVPVSSIQSAYPSIGTLLAVDITSRNGLGDWGGRVKQLVLRGTSGSVTITGDTFRSKFGLKSDWFIVTNGESGGVDGYWVVAPDGGLFAFGNAGYFGSMGGHPLNQPIVGMAAKKDNSGYWMVARDGGIFAFGSAKFFGSMGGHRLNQPIVGMAPTPSGNGYWLVASDGGIFAFGDARFFGSMGGTPLNKPVVGMASSGGDGYWMVASDGGIFAFGDARFYGSTGSIRLNSPVVGMTPERNGNGYWLVAGDGGIFAFNVPFHGSLPGIQAPGPAVDIRATSTNGGYLIVTGSGRVYPFGDAPYFGSVSDIPNYRGGVEGIEVKRTS